MKDSDLRFNLLTAAALGVVIILAPAAGRAADEAPGMYVGAGVQFTLNERLGVRGEWEKFDEVGNAATGENDIQMWTVGLKYKF